MPQVAYRVVRSRRKFVKAPEVKRMLGNAIDAEVKPHYIERFKEVIADWKHKPEFKSRKFIKTDSISVDVYPAGPHKDIWKWVSRGTKGPYPIPKAGPRYLAFQLGYQPRTRPRGKFGGPGKATGPWIRGVMQVQHPGIKAREFEEVIAEEEKQWFSSTMENIWRRTIRAL
jgi:hypothetical protein